MSAESLGHSGKILSTSPRGSEIDENEHGAQFPTKGPFVQKMNKQNLMHIEQTYPLNKQIQESVLSSSGQENQSFKL